MIVTSCNNIAQHRRNCTIRKYCERKTTHAFTGSSSGPLALCTFCNFDVARAHLSDLVNLRATFADDVSNKVIRNVD